MATSLHEAVADGDVVAVRRCISSSRDNVASTDGFNRTPLHIVASTAATVHPDVTTQLIHLLVDAHAPSLRARDHAGYTPLLCARTPEAASALVAAGGEPADTGPHGETLMHVALLEPAPSTDLIRAAIRLGVPTDAADCNGRTPLHLAAAGGHAESVRELLQAMASPHNLDLCRKGLSAAMLGLLRWSHEWRAEDAARDTAYRTVIDLLLQAHGQAALPADHPATLAALHSAVLNGAHPPVALLRAHELLSASACESILREARSRGTEPAAAEVLQPIGTDGRALANGALVALTADEEGASPGFLSAAEMCDALAAVAKVDWLAWCSERAEALAAGTARSQPMVRALEPPDDCFGVDACFGAVAVRRVGGAAELLKLLTAREATTPSLNVVGLPAAAVSSLQA